MKKKIVYRSALLLPLAFARAALGAIDPPPPESPPPATAAAPDSPAPPVLETPAPSKPQAPPYSLPWQLRPAAAVNVVRWDSSSGLRSIGGNGGTTLVTLLLASYKVTPDLSVALRGGFVSDAAPLQNAREAFLNPALGATYVVKLGSGFRLAPFLGLALPLGNGGGNAPDPRTRAALAAGALTRSSMDNALFAVNYLTPFPGIGLGWVSKGLTLQAEATLLQLFRAQGAAVDRDSTRTNFTSGLHAGYFIIPELSVSAELRYQRWLKNSVIAESDARRDTVTAALGVRAHFKLSEGMWLRPGLAYIRPLDGPMTDQNYHVAQLDVPFAF